MRSRAVRFNRANAFAFVRRLTLMLFATVALTMPVLGEDQKPDKKGAVLCAWGIYLIVQMHTAACGWARQPVDDAIDQAIADMEAFILANSSVFRTRAMLEDFKRGATGPSGFVDSAGSKERCEDPGVNRFVANIRQTDPDKFRESMKEFLSVPRDPQLNPCL
jgi:hypothetical protein